MIELDTTARAQSLLRHQLALSLSMLATALIFLFFTAPVGAEDEDLVAVLDIDPASTSGKEGVRMESEPPVLLFPPGQDGGESVVESVLSSSTDGASLEVSVKRFKQMTLLLERWPIDEFFHILEGQVEVANAKNGSVQTFGPGDSFVIPKNFEGVWKQLSDINMITVEYGVFGESDG